MPAEETSSVDPVRRADDEAMLQAEALAFGLLDPSVWELYWQKRTDDLKRRISERYPESRDGGTAEAESVGAG